MTKICPDCQAEVLSTSQPNRMGMAARAQMTDARERAAEAIYNLMPFDGDPIHKTKPSWMPGGNSLKQDEARRYADAALAATPAVRRGREVPLPPWIGGEDPLPRCEHGNCLRDGGGEILEPSCGCRGRAATPAVGGEALDLAEWADATASLFPTHADKYRRMAAILRAQPASLRENADRAHDALYGFIAASPLRGRQTEQELQAEIEACLAPENMRAAPPEQPAAGTGSRANDPGCCMGLAPEHACDCAKSGQPAPPEQGWLVPALDKAAARAADMPDWMTRSPAQGRQEPEWCPYAIDGCVLENQEIGPCLCALTSTKPDWKAAAERAKAAGDRVIADARVDPADLQKPYRATVTSTVPPGHELCSSCGRLFKFGETCTRGGCPCGGDV